MKNVEIVQFSHLTSLNGLFFWKEKHEQNKQPSVVADQSLMLA